MKEFDRKKRCDNCIHCALNTNNVPYRLCDYIINIKPRKHYCKTYNNAIIDYALAPYCEAYQKDKI